MLYAIKCEYKQFTTLLRFFNGRYYRDIESVSKGIEIALDEIVEKLHITDILYYTIIATNWVIGKAIYKNCDKQIA